MVTYAPIAYKNGIEKNIFMIDKRSNSV